jgi:hypothetical protein
MAAAEFPLPLRFPFNLVSAKRMIDNAIFIFLSEYVALIVCYL